MTFYLITDPKRLHRDRDYLVARITSGDHPIEWEIMTFNRPHICKPRYNGKFKVSDEKEEYIFKNCLGQEEDIDINGACYVYDLPLTLDSLQNGGR